MFYRIYLLLLLITVARTCQLKANETGISSSTLLGKYWIATEVYKGWNGTNYTYYNYTGGLTWKYPGSAPAQLLMYNFGNSSINTTFTYNSRVVTGSDFNKNGLFYFINTPNLYNGKCIRWRLYYYQRQYEWSCAHPLKCTTYKCNLSRSLFSSIANLTIYIARDRTDGTILASTPTSKWQDPPQFYRWVSVNYTVYNSKKWVRCQRCVEGVGCGTCFCGCLLPECINYT